MAFKRVPLKTLLLAVLGFDVRAKRPVDPSRQAVVRVGAHDAHLWPLDGTRLISSPQ